MAESATQERGFQATNAHRVVQALISLKITYTTPCAKIAIQATIPLMGCRVPIARKVTILPRILLAAAYHVLPVIFRPTKKDRQVVQQACAPKGITKTKWGS